MSERLATIYRAWPEIARRRSRRGALTSVFVLLSIGLIEPLACIIHCEIIELLVTPTASAAGVHHNHAHYTTAAKPTGGTLAAESQPDVMLLLLGVLLQHSRCSVAAVRPSPPQLASKPSSP